MRKITPGTETENGPLEDRQQPQCNEGTSPSTDDGGVPAAASAGGTETSLGEAIEGDDVAPTRQVGE